MVFQYDPIFFNTFEIRISNNGLKLYLLLFREIQLWFENENDLCKNLCKNNTLLHFQKFVDTLWAVIVIKKSDRGKNIKIIYMTY